MTTYYKGVPLIYYIEQTIAAQQRLIGYNIYKQNVVISK